MKLARFSPHHFVFTLVFVLGLVSAPSLNSATITWTNSDGGSWNTALNWTPNHVPGADDIALIAIPGGNAPFTVRLDANVTVGGVVLGSTVDCAGPQALSLNTKTLTLNGPLTVNDCGQFNLDSGVLMGGSNAVLIGLITWSGGVLNGTLTLATNSTLVLAGTPAQTYELYGALTNLGTVKLASGDLDLQGNITGRLYNLPGGLVEISADLTIFSYNNQGAIFNWGILRKSSGTGTTLVRPRFYNYGQVDAQSGTLAFTGGGTLNDGSSFGGTSSAQLAAGTYTVYGTVTASNAVLSGANLTGADGVLSGNWTWTDGSFAAGSTLTIATNSVLTLAGINDQAYELYGTLTNAGTFAMLSGNLQCQGNLQGLFINLAGGLLDVRADLSILNYNNRGSIVNWGTVRKSGGTGTANLWPAVYNQGTIEVQTGSISYRNATVLFGDGSRLTGAGTNLVSAGCTLAGTVTSQNLLVAGGPIYGAGTLKGAASWTAGELDSTASLTIAADGTLLITGPDQKAVVGLLNNEGKIVFAGPGRIAMGSKTTVAAIDNRPGATFEVTGDAPIQFGAYSLPAFTNSGVFRKSGGTGQTVLDGVLFHNTGTVDVQTGSVAYTTTGSRFENGSQLLGLGTNLLAAGNLFLNGSIYSENLELGGAVILGNSTLSGEVYWTRGVIADGTVVTVATNSNLLMTGSDDKVLLGVLYNQGTIQFSGTGRLAMGSQAGVALLNNQRGATFEALSDSLIGWTGYNQPAFTNAGTFRKSGGTATTLITRLLFHNSGIMDVRVGTVAYDASGTTFTFADGSKLLGAGTNLIYSGTFALNGAIYSENLQVAGTAVLQGTNVLNGVARWTSGAISTQGLLTVATNSSLLLSGPDDKVILGVLNNQGTVQFSGFGRLAMGSQTSRALLYNHPGATFEALSDALIGWTGFDQPAFTNAGTFRKSGGTGNTFISRLLFHNSGIVDVRVGTVAFDAFGTTFAFTDGSKLTGAGTNLIYSGTFALTGSIYSENLQVAGSAVLQGTGVLNGVASWTSGTISSQGVLTVATNSTLVIFGPDEKVILGVLNNQGVIQFSGTGRLAMGSQVGLALLDNQPGATFETLSDAFIGWTGLDQPAFTNAGIFRARGPASTTVLQLPFINSGTLDAQTGTINLAGAYNLSGGKLNFGISSLTNYGRITFSTPASLAGSISAECLGAYQPAAGNSFPVLGYPSRTGTFGPVQLPACAAWQTNYEAITFSLQVLNARPFLVEVSAQQVDELKTLLITNSATHTDGPPQTLSFELLSPPPGMYIDSASGVISWTPTQTQSPSTNLVSVRVIDSGVPALSSTNSFTVVVREVNMAPILPVFPTLTVDELTTLRVTNTATEPNIHSTTTGYTLLSSPSGAQISSDGTITWTIGQEQSPSTNTFVTIVTNANLYDTVTPQLTSTNSFVVVVREVNVVPVLPTVPAQSTYELTLLRVTNTAFEPNIHSRLEYRLEAPLPGMSIDTNGVFSWTPSHAQAPTFNPVTTVVTSLNPYDLIHPSLSATNTFYVIVYQRPVLLAPSISPSAGFQFTIQTVPGETYTVLYSTNLQTWTPQMTFDGNGSTLTIHDKGYATNTAGFYRVQVTR